MVSLLIFACATTPILGLIDDGSLLSPEGTSLRLVVDAAHAEVSYLDGCTVEITGPQVAHRIWVREWRVLASIDGSTPYIGPLRAHGSNLVLEDRDSGFDILLEEPSAAPLWEHAGEPVMVVGLVVAPQVVRVMGWRLLSDAGPAGSF